MSSVLMLPVVCVGLQEVDRLLTRAADSSLTTLVTSVRNKVAVITLNDEILDHRQHHPCVYCDEHADFFTMCGILSCFTVQVCRTSAIR